jgi:hypothetical protein
MDSEISKPPKPNESTDSDSKTIRYNFILKITFPEKTFNIILSYHSIWIYSYTRQKCCSFKQETTDYGYMKHEERKFYEITPW